MPNPNVKRCSWVDEAISGVPGASVGMLRPLDDRECRVMPALVFRDAAGALLLALNQRGFLSLPVNVPTLWVTAPTREQTGLGFAVNADFELDAGRAQLARDTTRNFERADRLGWALGGSLCDLFDASHRDWGDLKGVLRLGADVDPIDLWESLWRILGPPLLNREGSSADLVRRMLWDRPDLGMSRLYGERDALPSGLPGDYRTLTRLGRVTHATGGLLADKSVFSEVASWPGFRGVLGPGTMIADEVHQGLRSLMAGSPPSCPAITLTSALRDEVGREGEVGPELAARLGQVIHPEFLRPSRHGRQEEDRIKLLDVVKTLRFRARDGQWRHAVDLLIDALDTAEESLRARFAPDDRVLAPDYRGAGLEFFRACRPGQQMRAGVDLLASWAIEASDPRRRKAVMDYLASSYESNKLADYLYQDRRHSWIKRLRTDSELIAHHDTRRRNILLSQLDLLSAADPAPSPPVRLDPQRVLLALHARWMEQGPTETARYEEMIYPDGQRPTWYIDNLGDDEEARRGWFILLALGALHTQGRTRTWQDGGFLQLWSRSSLARDLVSAPGRRRGLARGSGGLSPGSGGTDDVLSLDAALCRILPTLPLARRVRSAVPRPEPMARTVLAGTASCLAGRPEVPGRCPAPVERPTYWGVLRGSRVSAGRGPRGSAEPARPPPLLCAGPPDPAHSVWAGMHGSG